MCACVCVCVCGGVLNNSVKQVLGTDNTATQVVTPPLGMAVNSADYTLTDMIWGGGGGELISNTTTDRNNSWSLTRAFVAKEPPSGRRDGPSHADVSSHHLERVTL